MVLTRANIVRGNVLKCPSCGGGLLVKEGNNIYLCQTCNHHHELATVQDGAAVRIGWVNKQ